MSHSLERKIHVINEWLGPGTINVFGRPFAGKDCNGKKLAIAINAPLTLGGELIGGGHILRNSYIPAEVDAAMVRGELIDSEEYTKIVLPYLGSSAFTGLPFVLSSVGRVKGEEKGVLAATEAAGHKTKVVPYLDITNDETVARFRSNKRCQRADDTEEAVRIRLEQYEAKTKPVIEEYESMGLLLRIDAMQEKDIVYQAFIHSLHDFASN